ncbi:unnamed protein product [Nyctereutes procyonoides]|uniref:(raccoon dog) hypothetical protein n=1 Tax=Nyctereutes procyonoides TaxID=34880 RepID=A0A811YPJ5_NYCPR|nr:unnamed protein product [Nyctereutes procyonoides]CAD7679595.1 unnamed protein product [Nyctereutes procyonoides]
MDGYGGQSHSHTSALPRPLLSPLLGVPSVPRHPCSATLPTPKNGCAQGSEQTLECLLTRTDGGSCQPPSPAPAGWSPGGWRREEGGHHLPGLLDTHFWRILEPDSASCTTWHVNLFFCSQSARLTSRRLKMKKAGLEPETLWGPVVVYWSVWMGLSFRSHCTEMSAGKKFWIRHGGRDCDRPIEVILLVQRARVHGFIALPGPGQAHAFYPGQVHYQAGDLGRLVDIQVKGAGRAQVAAHASGVGLCSVLIFKGKALIGDLAGVGFLGYPLALGDVELAVGRGHVALLCARRSVWEYPEMRHRSWMVVWVSPTGLQEEWKSFTVGGMKFKAHARSRGSHVEWRL